MSNKTMARCLGLPSKRRKTIQITQQLHDTIKQHALQNGQTLEYVVRKAVEEYLKNKK